MPADMGSSTTDSGDLSDDSLAETISDPIPDVDLHKIHKRVQELGQRIHELEDSNESLKIRNRELEHKFQKVIELPGLFEGLFESVRNQLEQNFDIMKKYSEDLKNTVKSEVSRVLAWTQNMSLVLRGDSGPSLVPGFVPYQDRDRSESDEENEESDEEMEDFDMDESERKRQRVCDPESPELKMKLLTTTVPELILEWLHGTDGRMSVEEKDKVYGTEWRKGRKAQSFYFKRAPIIKFLKKIDHDGPPVLAQLSLDRLGRILQNVMTERGLTLVKVGTSLPDFQFQHEMIEAMEKMYEPDLADEEI